MPEVITTRLQFNWMMIQPKFSGNPCIIITKFIEPQVPRLCEEQLNLVLEQEGFGLVMSLAPSMILPWQTAVMAIRLVSTIVDTTRMLELYVLHSLVGCYPVYASAQSLALCPSLSLISHSLSTAMVCRSV